MICLHLSLHLSFICVVSCTSIFVRLWQDHFNVDMFSLKNNLTLDFLFKALGVVAFCMEYYFDEKVSAVNVQAYSARVELLHFLVVLL